MPSQSIPSASITVNGTKRTVPCGWSVANLLTDVGIRPERVAVEVNQQILDCQDFATRLLQPGDDVEIITFVGGGFSES